MTENDAISLASDLLTACIPSAACASVGDVAKTDHRLIYGMIQALGPIEARLVLTVMTAFASRLIQLRCETYDLAPEDIVMTMRQVRV